MPKTVAIRSGKDRLRYSIVFEVTLMVFLVPAGAAFFEKNLTDIGVLGLILSIKAMLVSLIFNWCSTNLMPVVGASLPTGQHSPGFCTPRASN